MLIVPIDERAVEARQPDDADRAPDHRGQHRSPSAGAGSPVARTSRSDGRQAGRLADEQTVEEREAAGLQSAA